MISILEGLFLKISALFMSLFISVGTTFGAFVPATTTEAVNYRDTNIKNVIYLINTLFVCNVSFFEDQGYQEYGECHGYTG